MLVVTGATGQLGRLVINQLLQAQPASSIVAALRNPAKAAELAALGVQVRHADYTQPATLRAAFAGSGTILLISSSEVGARSSQPGRVQAMAATPSTPRTVSCARREMGHNPTAHVMRIGASISSARMSR